MPRIYKSAAAVLNLQRPQAKTDWYRITNQAGAPTQVHVYDEIGLFGVSASQFIADMAEIKGELEIHLNSPGGEIFDGITIYNALRPRQPAIVVDGLAASIASVIAMAAAPGKLLIEPTASMMIHDGFTMAAGNAAELTALAQLLNEQSEIIAGIYAARTGQPQALWRERMQAETWYTGPAAVEAGLADGLVGTKDRQQVVLLNEAPAESAPWDPDHDGDDDSTPEGDTDHSHWAPDGTQLKPVPGKPMTAAAQASAAEHTARLLAGPADEGDELVQFLASALRDAAQPHGVMSGTHSHPHPAYGAQGGDESHDHEHSHDGDSAHSHGHQAGNHWHPVLQDADKYKQADRDRMAKSGEAMPDGSYPIADGADLDNAIQAVGRGGADHDDIRRHVIKRAKALGQSSKIPDSWGSDGSLKTDTSTTDSVADLFRIAHNSLKEA